MRRECYGGRGSVVSRLPTVSYDAAAPVELTDAAASPDEAVQRKMLLERVAAAIAELPERLQVVVRGYFLEELPMADIAVELGVTESRVSQLRAQALVLLREALGRALEPEMLLGPEPEGVAARRRRAYADTVAARHASRRPVPPRFRLQTA